jgi:hypothetical protein
MQELTATGLGADRDRCADPADVAAHGRSSRTARGFVEMKKELDRIEVAAQLRAWAAQIRSQPYATSDEDASLLEHAAKLIERQHGKK